MCIRDRDIEFKWSPKCKKELEYLKNCLASDPILKPIDLNRDIVISCDASIYGIGFVIMQMDDDGMLMQSGMAHMPPHLPRLITQQRIKKQSA